MTIVSLKDAGLLSGKGRRTKLSVEQLEEMKSEFNAGVAKTEIAKKYSVTRAYVYQLMSA